MPESYPSKALTVLDIPETSGVKLKFHYHFFTKDEKVNEDGDSLTFLTNKDVADTDLHRKIPRMVEFSFKTISLQQIETSLNEFVTDLSKPENIRNVISNNLDKIQSEVDVAGDGYSSLVLQENAIADATARFLDMSARLRSEDGNTIEKAKIISKLTSIKSMKNRVLSYLKEPDSSHVKFIDNDTGGFIVDETLDNLTGMMHYIQADSKYIGSLMRKLVGNPFHSLSSPASSALEDCEEMQEAARKKSGESSISEDDYLPSIIEISKTLTDDENIPSSVKIMGYILEKDEVLADGTLISKDPVIVEGVSSCSGVDYAVKYGATYAYAVRTIAMAQFASIEEDSGDLYLISALITSRPSKSSIIECVETSPPPPPRDINFVWDYRDRNLMLTWSMPIVYSRDVKRFQVFRRLSVSDPFELIQEYDFDDSIIKTPRCENVSRFLIKKHDAPLTTFIDSEFTRDSKFIYSLCSIDAHDLTSNYSEQYEISFDRIKNQLIKKQVAYSNSPKPFPNYYLMSVYAEEAGTSSLTVDLMKDSKHTSVKIFFDPEYLSVVDKKGNDLKLIASGEDGSRYKMQFINVDRQLSQVINIKIDDLRS